MPKALKSLVLTGLVALFTAAAASSAHATGALEIYENDGGGTTHCGNVLVDEHSVTGGCEMTAVNSGTVELEAEVFGFHVHEADCDSAFTMNFNEDGTGYISDQTFSNCSSTVAGCTEDGSPPAEPWLFEAEEDASETVSFEIDVCVVSTIVGHCSGVLTVQLDDSGEDYVMFADGRTIGSSPCELDMTYIVDEEHFGEVHFNHL